MNECSQRNFKQEHSNLPSSKTKVSLQSLMTVVWLISTQLSKIACFLFLMNSKSKKKQRKERKKSDLSLIKFYKSIPSLLLCFTGISSLLTSSLITENIRRLETDLRFRSNDW